MRIVTYNVNGLRARLSHVRPLPTFLDSLDADIICIQETKLCRQELSADIAVAAGYESFFSCTRTAKKGRIGYSGVATFCRVASHVNASDAVPLAADEGFTGLLHCSKDGKLTQERGRVGCYQEVWNMEDMSAQELLRLDSEGRCVVTDHGSFVLFNIYGPRVQAGDSDRLQFKLDFFRALQCRWEGLLREGRAVIAVGDFNISPFPIDSCDPGPEFEQNPCRVWLRSMLSSGGGPFVDVFRQLHPHRGDAYTCWSQASGAEEFNFGTRIDLILVAGPCSHADRPFDSGSHFFGQCEVEGSDILLAHKRAKTDSLPRWAGGRSLKLEGSDHAPVYVKLRKQPCLPAHDVPPLAARFMPELRGRQQSIVSLFQKQPHGPSDERPKRKHDDSWQESVTAESCNGEHRNGAHLEGVQEYGKMEGADCTPLQGNLQLQGNINVGNFQFSTVVGTMAVQQDSRSVCAVIVDPQKAAKAGKKSSSDRNSNGQRAFQSSLQSFFARAGPGEAVVEKAGVRQGPIKLGNDTGFRSTVVSSYDSITSFNTEDSLSLCGDEKQQQGTGLDRAEVVGGNGVESGGKQVTAAAEWQRIQQFMAANVPLCRGHGEPCVVRQVKKAGPNIGRGFYVCARAQGPASNPAARCDHFEWASMKARSRRPGLGNGKG